MTPENVRFHAAGHLAAAVTLVRASNIDGARAVLGVVKEYLEHPLVDNPPQFRATVDRAIADPAAEAANIEQLEVMFCHPANTGLEQAGIRMGKG